MEVGVTTRWVGVVVSVCAAGVALVVPEWADAAPSRPTALPAGFTTSSVASVTSPTAIEVLPDNTVVVLQQGGQVRLISNGALLPGTALNLSVCLGAERGLLGFTSDPEFLVNRQVYVYYTRTDPTAPGGCVNRVSRFTMPSPTSIDPASEIVLVDNLSSVNGNHNAGDLDVGKDGFLYISTGDAGRDPRGDSGSAGANDAAQDLSLLNGKILRVDRFTGEAAPGNPLLAQGAVACRVRGNTPATPTTPCAEIYAWGLRNPFRFAFDPNTGPQRFFINDVGQGTREEVDDGAIGRNYGWNIREGQCNQGQSPPCVGPTPNLTDPITDYGRTIGTYITAGAFIPDGWWPQQYDGGYLFADGGVGKMWLRRADGTVDYANPFATDLGQIADMTFVRESDGFSLWYTVAGATTSSVRRITSAAVVDPDRLVTTRFVAEPAARRVLDTRLTSAGAQPILAGSTRFVPMGVDGATTRAVLVNLAYVAPSTDGFLTAWAARHRMPPTANVNARSGEVVSNMAIVPVDSSGGILLYSLGTGHVVVDVLGSFVASNPATAGRVAPVNPVRLADTRERVTLANAYTRVSGTPYPRVTVPILGRGGVPSTGVSAVVLVVTALSGSGPEGGFLTATAGGAPWPGSANLNINGSNDIRPNTVVVPVGANGAIDLHLYVVQDVVVDVAGYFTDATAPSSASGLFVSLAPQREADTRIGLGFARLDAGSTRTLDPLSVPDALAIAQNIALVNNAGPGFVTPFPAEPRPFVAAGNATAPNQVRSISTFTKLGANGVESYYAYMATDLVVDVTGYFQR
jgi:glucose/arabinose dehydrogenase